MKMNAGNVRILEALNCFLNGEKVTWKEEMTDEEWSEFFRLGRIHQILPMVYEAVYNCRSFQSFSREKVREVKQQMIREVMLQGRKTEEFLALYRELTGRGLTPLVVKGLVCREMYREPDYRASGDEDVLIPAEEFQIYDEALQRSGMRRLQPGADPEKEGEVPYYKEGGLLHIELHKELFSSESEAYGGLNELFTDAFARKTVIEAGGTQIYTMCHTDHLLYLILHAFKHFLHSGFGIRQVCDIVVYANTYGKEVDWEYLLEKCREIHADIFAASLFDIGEKKLNFDRERAGIPESWNRLEADGDDLLDDLMDGGVFGDSSMSRKHSSNITLQAAAEDRKGKKAGSSLVQSLFPDRKYMERTYTYVKKHPFLLPAAWAARIVNYLRETKRTGGNNARESIDIGNHRVNLMRKYKIIQ